MNAPTILMGALGSMCILVSCLLMTGNEASFIKNDLEKRLLNDTAFLVRGVGHELFIIGTLAWCSVANGHSNAVARWWAVGLIPSVWNKWISGDQGGATMNAVIGLICLFFGSVWKTTKATRILMGTLGSLSILVSCLLMTGNEASFLKKGDVEERLFKDNAFLIRAVGHECFLLGMLAWCSVVNGHSDAVARWWAVGVVPSVWNKWISGDQAGATTNAVIGLICLFVGWVCQKATVPAKMVPTASSSSMKKIAGYFSFAFGVKAA